MLSRSQEAQIEAGKQEMELFGGSATQAIEGGSFPLDTASAESRVTDPATQTIEYEVNPGINAKLLKVHSLFNARFIETAAKATDSVLRRSY